MFEGELIMKIKAASLFDAKWEFKKFHPNIDNNNVKVLVKGRVKE